MVGHENQGSIETRRMKCIVGMRNMMIHIYPHPCTDVWNALFIAHELLCEDHCIDFDALRLITSPRRECSGSTRDNAPPMIMITVIPFGGRQIYGVNRVEGIADAHSDGGIVLSMNPQSNLSPGWPH